MNTVEIVNDTRVLCRGKYYDLVRDTSKEGSGCYACAFGGKSCKLISKEDYHNGSLFSLCEKSFDANLETINFVRSKSQPLIIKKIIKKLPKQSEDDKLMAEMLLG
jgi:hypothetical protein